MMPGDAQPTDRPEVRAARAAAARAWIRGEASALAAWCSILECDRESYDRVCADALHPMSVLNALFAQLSPAERRGEVPVEPAWRDACDFELFAAFSQVADADRADAAAQARTRFLYVTDLHGDAAAYGALPELCATHDVRIIVQGGDMLPKGRDMFAAQREFLRRDLPECLDRCCAKGIAFLGLFGNDDLRGVHGEWLSLVGARRGVYDLARRWYTLPGGVVIRGCSWVPDYLFGLKDWCLRDRPEALPVATRGRSVVTSPDGVEEIDDPAAFFAARPTLEEHLDSLVAPGHSMERAVLVSHAPPGRLGLGRLWSGEDVGSKSVHAWIARNQPLLTLSGHIHESPDVGLASEGTPRHTAQLGRTTCHQPGQVLPGELVYSVVEVDGAGGVGIDWRHVRL